MDHSNPEAPLWLEEADCAVVEYSHINLKVQGSIPERGCHLINQNSYGGPPLRNGILIQAFGE